MTRHPSERSGETGAMTFSWEMAEELAAAHMRGLGYEDARRTLPGTDRGIDVLAARAVAQVKYLSAPVGSPDIQRFRGAAHGVDRAFFYSASGYTAAAISVADETGIGLFRFDESNAVSAVNAAAEEADDQIRLLRELEAAGVTDLDDYLSRFHEARKHWRFVYAATNALSELVGEVISGEVQAWPDLKRDMARFNEIKVVLSERNQAVADLATLYRIDDFERLVVSQVNEVVEFIGGCGFDQDAFNARWTKWYARLTAEE